MVAPGEAYFSARNSSLDPAIVEGYSTYEFLDTLEEVVMKYYKSRDYDPGLLFLLGTSATFTEGREYDEDGNTVSTFPRGILGQDIDDLIEAKNLVFGERARLGITLSPVVDDTKYDSTHDPEIKYELSGIIYTGANRYGPLNLEILTFPDRLHFEGEGGISRNDEYKIKEVYVELDLGRFGSSGNGVIGMLTRQDASNLIEKLLASGNLPQNSSRETFYLRASPIPRQKSAANTRAF